MHLFTFTSAYHFNLCVKKGYISTCKWAARGSQAAVLHAAAGTESQGGEQFYWDQEQEADPAKYPSATPQEYPQLSATAPFPCQGSIASSKHQVWLSPESVQHCWHNTAGWCSCSPVKQMLLSQQRTAAGWLLPSYHHWHQQFFVLPSICKFSHKWQEPHTQPGLGFGNISNYFCYRQNGVLEPTSPLGFLHVVSSGATVDNACQHHRRYMAVRSTGFQTILLQGRWEAAATVF